MFKSGQVSLGQERSCKVRIGQVRLARDLGVHQVKPHAASEGGIGRKEANVERNHGT